MAPHNFKEETQARKRQEESNTTKYKNSKGYKRKQHAKDESINTLNPFNLDKN